MIKGRKILLPVFFIGIMLLMAGIWLPGNYFTDNHKFIFKDSTEINRLNDFAWDLHNTEPAKSRLFADSALELAIKNDWDDGKERAWSIIGTIYFNQGDNLKALEYFEMALEMAKKSNNGKMLTKVYGDIGGVYLQLSYYPKALEYYQQALNYAESQSDNVEKRRVLCNIGLVHHNMSDYNKALEYYHKSLDIAEKTGDKSGMEKILGNIGLLYFDQLNYTKALENYKIALKISEETANKHRVGINYGNIGVIYHAMRQYELAGEYYEKAFKIAENLGEKSNMALWKGDAGNIYYSRAVDSLLVIPFEEKKALLLKAISIQQLAVNDFEQIEELDNEVFFLFSLADSYRELRDYKNALLTYKKGIVLNDSIFSATNRKKIADIEFAREKLISEKEKQLLMRKIQIQKLEFDRHTEQVDLLQSEHKVHEMEYGRQIDKLKLLEKDKKLKEVAIRQKSIEADKNARQADISKLMIKSRKNRLLALVSGILLLSFFFVIILIQRQKSEQLLLNVLPASIARRLKKSKGGLVVDHFEKASIVFCDIAGFTQISASMDPEKIVEILNDVFSRFDNITGEMRMEKIKTIGDCYMAVAGIPETSNEHALMAAKWAVEVQKQMKGYKLADGTEMKFRIGIDCGSVVAGVIGKDKFSYDLWGHAVNMASRMESFGVAAEIQVTGRFRDELQKSAPLSTQFYRFRERGEITLKGREKERAFILEYE